MQLTIHSIQQLKNQQKKIVALTAYDYSTAKILDNANVDIILVGDSLAQVVLGYESTVQLSLDEMLHHVRAVARGVKRSFLVADMPFLTYQASRDDAVLNAGKCLQAGAKAVKVEGASEDILLTIKKMIEVGIPVMGHIGFTPQSVNALGGNKIQGRTAKDAKRLLDEAKKLEEAGCFAIVVELIPSEVASLITNEIKIPTIGIGAGADCSGQILVIDDLIGKFTDFKPSFVRRYAEIGKDIDDAVKKFIEDVKNNNYPNFNESFFMNENEVENLKSI